MTHAEQVGKVKGAMAVAYYCKVCNPATGFKVILRLGVEGRGKAWGLTSASQARASVISHIKTSHSEGTAK